MNLFTLLIVILIVLALTGSFRGWYPHQYGWGGGGLLLIILIVLLLSGRL